MTIIGKAIDAILKIDQAWFDIPLWEDPNGISYNAQCDLNGYLYVSIGGSIVPIEVEGAVADDDPIDDTHPLVGGGVYFSNPTANPIDDGDAGWTLLNAYRMTVVDTRAVVENADPAAMVDGVYHNLRLDDVGRLIVTDPAASPYVEGPDADDTPVTGQPVQVGGVYYADPTADPIDDGDVGYLLINELRMLITESRTYDPPSDADKNIPVWNETDLWTPEDLSGTAGADGTTSYYVALEENSRYSLQYVPAPANDELITVTLHQSNEDDPDITARTYTDITQTFWGVLGFTEESWVETESPTRAKSMRVDVTVSGWTAGTTVWTLYLVKGGNS